jgi:nitroimidazol reductase NimA-like FMN-containing flavoprotein (pyridoxamine 5'-phosphate oxidase superfamily)
MNGKKEIERKKILTRLQENSKKKYWFFIVFGKLSDLQTTSEISEYLCDELLFAMILDTTP